MEIISLKLYLKVRDEREWSCLESRKKPEVKYLEIKILDLILKSLFNPVGKKWRPNINIVWRAARSTSKSHMRLEIHTLATVFNRLGLIMCGYGRLCLVIID